MLALKFIASLFLVSAAGADVAEEVCSSSLIEKKGDGTTPLLAIVDDAADDSLLQTMIKRAWVADGTFHGVNSVEEALSTDSNVDFQPKSSKNRSNSPFSDISVKANLTMHAQRQFYSQNDNVLPLSTALPNLGWFDVFLESFCIVAIAELFDKTWFIVLLMALRHNKIIVLLGCSMALIVHIAVAAVVGHLIAQVVPIAIINYGAAVLFSGFTLFYLIDAYNADPSIDMGAVAARDPTDEHGNDAANNWGVTFLTCFVTTFMAQIGGRTEVAIVGLTLSKPLVPVCAGSLGAFLRRNLSAVLAALMLETLRFVKLTERTVCLCCAFAFAACGVLALREGLAGPS